MSSRVDVTLIQMSELDALSRLDTFDYHEVLLSYEMEDAQINSELTGVMTIAHKLMDESVLLLENGNFILLEYSVHKLLGIFVSIGCNKLAFLLEQINTNLIKIRIDFLRKLFLEVKREFKLAKTAISKFFQDDIRMMVPTGSY